MSRFDLRWAARHPLRWLRHWWLHVAAAGCLWGIGTAWTEGVVAPVAGLHMWPLFVFGVGCFVFASALAPFSRRLTAFTGATLVALGITRAIAFASVIATGRGDIPVLTAAGLLWLLVAALGIIWPDYTRARGAESTVEAGWDDQEGPRA